MNLLFCIDRHFIPLLLDCTHSILKNGGMDHYDAYVLHSDLAEDDQAAIVSGAPGMTFHFIPVPDDLFAGFPTTKRYPLQIYYRLAAPLLLPPEVERILYLDVDTVVINSLQELATIPFEDAWFMACTHVHKTLSKLNQARLGLPPESRTPYLNSGVVLFDLPTFRAHLDLRDIQNYANAKKNALFLPDQDILTALYGEHVKLLDSLRYNLSDRILSLHNADPKHSKLDTDWVRANTVVVHYCGRNKPWKEGYTGILGTFYQENKRPTL